MRLTIGRFYRLEGMEPEMWDAGHPRYGKPNRLDARYLGALRGTRRWHGFEIVVRGKDEGSIFMTDKDLAQLRVTPL